MLRRGGEAGRPREMGVGVGVGCGLKRVHIFVRRGERMGEARCGSGLLPQLPAQVSLLGGLGGFGGPRWRTWACGVGLKMSLFSCPFGPFSPPFWR